jgi:RimJ/RimL family protein N-acetyltransferase
MLAGAALLGEEGQGSNGSTLAHCASVNTVKRDIRQQSLPPPPIFRRHARGLHDGLGVGMSDDRADLATPRRAQLLEPITYKAGRVILKTKRLQLAPLGPALAEQLWDVYSDPDVARFIGGGSLTHATTREQATWFSQVWKERGCGQSAVFLRETGQVIGRTGLSYWPEWKEVELGYVLIRAAQGRGLAQEGAQAWIDWAIAHLSEDHLIAVIHPDNAASARLAQRLGFSVDRHEVTRGIEVVVHRLDIRPADQG